MGFIDKFINEYEVVVIDDFSYVDFYYKLDVVKVLMDVIVEFFNK